jgi:DNA-binding winged helix-turn-helix (wHTH) protein/Tol biopolymer transport system component
MGSSGFPTDRIFRFGQFELSEREGELRKNGVRIKLQDQPFQVLAELLANAGRIVTREELQRKLWPAETFVDFDVGLNTAIRKLRQALNDDADNPRYIETLARRGYRFVGQAAVISTEPAPLGELTPAPSPDAAPPEKANAVGESSPQALPAEKPNEASGRKWTWAALGAGAALLIAGLVFWWARPPAVPVVEAITQLTEDGRAKGVHESLQTDGSRLYFNEGRRGSLEIAQAAVTGGPVSLLPTPLIDAQPEGIASDGSFLIVLEGGAGPPPKPVWKVPLPTGEPVRLGNLEAQGAGVTPDGHILLSSLGDLYIAENDGSHVRKIIAGVDGFIGNQTTSPDGRQIVFTRYPVAGPPELFVANADGSGVRLIARNDEAGGFCCARWIPDGRYLVFESRAKAQQDIWYLPTKRGWLHRTREPKKLTAGPFSFHDPVPSRDGQTVFALGTKERGELVRYDMKAKHFVPVLGGISATNVSFSRDGKWAAYRSFPDLTLWRSRSDGTDRLQLTYSPVGETSAFSPDGKQVEYEADGNIYLISTDGGQPQAIVNDGRSGAADWSPDGHMIVFLTATDRYGSRANLLNLASGKRSALPSLDDFRVVRWISDDKLVAGHVGSEAFSVLDLNSQTWSDWTIEPKPEVITRWGVSPSQQYLYYATGGPDAALMRVRLGDHRAEEIARLKDFQFATFIQIHLSDQSISLAPDGSPILARDTGAQEIYALTVRWP